MRIIDTHVHIFGDVDITDLIREMDENGVERSIILSMYDRRSLRGTREHLLDARRMVKQFPDRLDCLAFVNPTIPGMASLCEEALGEMGFAGLKIIPDHYYVTDESLEPFWEAMNRAKASILFHTGMLSGFDDSSRFCRPIYLEKLVHYPHIRFSMAHVAWPWIEECLAVMGRFRDIAETPDAWQSYVDITIGPPPHIRKQAVANAIAFSGADHVVFGSDASLPGGLDSQKRDIREWKRIFAELGLDDVTQERIFSGTADELFPHRV